MAETPKQPGNVRDKAQGAAQTAGQAVGSAAQKAGEAATNLGDKAQQLASAASERAGQAVQSVGQGMSSLAGTLRQNAPHEGMLGSAASTVAQGLEAGGHYLQEHDLGDITQDLGEFVRRYPVQCMLGALAVGFMLGSLRR
jgi:hypothetical protein